MTKNRISLDKLPNDLINSIALYLNENELLRIILAIKDKNIYHLFKPMLRQKHKDKLIRFAALNRPEFIEKYLSKELKADDNFMHKLLFHHVVFGQQAEAEKILILKPELLFINSVITDYSFRVFEITNPFRYALWAKDSIMLSMLIFYLSKLDGGLDYARVQFAEHKNVGLNYKRTLYHQDIEVKNEKHYDFARLVALLSDYAIKWLHQNTDDLADQIAKAQQEVVVHIAQHYCDPKESFSWNSNFTKANFNRTLKLYGLCSFFIKDAVWYPLQSSTPYSDPELLHSVLAVTRGDRRPHFTRGLWGSDVEDDANAIKKLHEVRSNDINAIEKYLTDPMNNPLPKHLIHEPCSKVTCALM